MPTDLPKKMKEFYGGSTAYRDHLAAKSQEHYRNFLNLVTKHVPAGSSMLEIGAGTGQVSRQLALGGYRVTAADISPLFLRVPRALTRSDSTPPAYLAADVARLPLRDDVFDAVIAGELLEHLSEVSLALDEMCRVIRPQGMLVLRSPALASPIWPLIDLPRLLSGRGGRPPHYETPAQAAKFFFANCLRTARAAMRREPEFELRSPELDPSVEGGDRDAAYWSSAVEVARYLRKRGFEIRQQVEIGHPRAAGWMLQKLAPWMSPTIALVAVKRP